MLQQFTITGGACFGSDPLTVSGLQPINFFFGPNGSGKTTISRAFEQDSNCTIQPSWDDSVPMSFSVYNRDFVDRVLRESSRIPGVFVLGEKSVEAEKRLDDIQKPGGLRAGAKDELDRAKKSLEEAEKRRDEAYSSFKTAAWQQYKRLRNENSAISSAFTGRGGVGNDSNKLAAALIEMSEPSDDNPAPQIEDLLNKAEAIFSDDATTKPELPLISDFNPEGYEILSESIAGSTQVSLSDLVAKLGNIDWVSAGREYFGDANGVCPFCQQETPHDFAIQLAGMFDDHYKTKIRELQSFDARFRSWADAATASIDGFEDEEKTQLDQVRFLDVKAALQSAVTKNRSALTNKLRAPSENLVFSPVGDCIDRANDVIKDANAQIRAHNELVRSREDGRPKLVAECWRYLSEVLLRDQISDYRQRSEGHKRGIDALSAKVAAASDKLGNFDREIRDLQRSVESTQPAIDQINELLMRAGFTSFEIVASSELQDAYMLSREGRAISERSLSEGEQTFIAFLYYFHRLAGRDSSGVGGHTVAVIDDPISSLDSDVLFIVGALVRNLISRALSGTDRISQIILLTHNVYFHKEITHLRTGDPGKGRSYFVIRKRPSAPSSIEPHQKNPISTEYQRLWAEVSRAVAGEPVSVTGLENILRRILESYFRILGSGIWEDDLIPLMNESERPVLRSLFNWINEGSHAIFDNLYYSPGPATPQTYLDVFRRVFEVTNHESHYNMMLYGKASLDTSTRSIDTQP